MVGKGALIVIFGFISAFTVYQLKLASTAVSATDNFNQEYINTLVHESALSAMNIGITEVWDKAVKDSSFSFVINNCSTSVIINSVGLDTVKLKVKSWRYAFHEETFRISRKAKKIQDSVVAYFVYNTPASRFFWFTNEEGNIYWTTGDSVWGPVHTNDVLKTSGAPVFYGKVTAKLGISPLPDYWWNNAKFYGGWEIGVENQVPTDLEHLIHAAIAGNGGAATNTKSIYDTETTFEFLSSGDVIRTVGDNPPDTVSLEEIAPTGVIYSTEDIRVKGTLNGIVTLCSEQNIWIDDDIVYAGSGESDDHDDEEKEEDKETRGGKKGHKDDDDDEEDEDHDDDEEEDDDHDDEEDEDHDDDEEEDDDHDDEEDEDHDDDEEEDDDHDDEEDEDHDDDEEEDDEHDDEEDEDHDDDDDEEDENDDNDSQSSSDDILGLVAKYNVIVTDNPANNDDVEIHAAIMAINGSFLAENYDSRPVAGELRVVGSMVQNSRGPIGTFNWWNKQLISGFNKNYRFDTRFSAISPPYYPYVRQLRLVAWWE